MKRFFFALLSVVLLAAPAFARGPWDAGIPGNPVTVNPSNINGSYQGSIKGKNMTGVMRFTSSSSGQITVTSTNYVVIYSSGTGARLPIGVATYVNTQVLSASGYAHFFMAGATGQATIDTAIDLSARTLSGLIEGGAVRGTTVATQVLSNPNLLVAGIPTPTTWTVTNGNNTYFNGYFDANLSKNWAANSFSGKGTLTVSTLDIAGFNAALANPATAATATPQIVTVPLSIKVAGVKTMDATTPYTPNVTFAMPTVTQNP